MQGRVAGQRAARQPNRLIASSSPYLLQHAFNPIEWYPWGEEALSRARREDRPIFLSVGYSACHWCHVMARESFEDPRIADLLNGNFVPVKVDREERPDIDEVYMAATIALNQGQGGWPMSVFLTPDAQPFYAGTYFPPEDHYGRPGFRALLRSIVELWRGDREGLVRQAAQITAHLRALSAPAPKDGLGAVELRLALAQLEGAFDPRHGGFGAAPKFPQATTIALLLRLSSRLDSNHALEMARATLEGMARGGIRDHIGGGFHRYATDERWLVPHFEKMLYDNALLARVYVEGSQATGDASFAQVARETLDYILREMTAPGGGFYSATDADSEGVEGKYYVWRPDEIAAVLGEDAARLFCAYYDITETGNWEGKSIAHRLDPERVVAWRAGAPLAQIRQVVTDSLPLVLAERQRRVPPGLDDKILAAWNGLAIGALAAGYRVLDERRYLDAAVRGADFVLGSMRDSDGRLLRIWRGGRASVSAFLEDHALVAEGLIDLYEAGASQRYLDAALELAEQMLARFRADDGSFFATARDHEALLLRPREGHDGALPSANATAAHVMARLSYHFDRPDLRDAARQAIDAYGKAIARQPQAFAKSLIVLDYLMDGPVALALVGCPSCETYAALAREIGRHFLPRQALAHTDAGPSDCALPALLVGRETIDGRAALYVCRSGTCQSPVTDPAGVAAALSA